MERRKRREKWRGGIRAIGVEGHTHPSSFITISPPLNPHSSFQFSSSFTCKFLRTPPPPPLFFFFSFFFLIIFSSLFLGIIRNVTSGFESEIPRRWSYVLFVVVGVGGWGRRHRLLPQRRIPRCSNRRSLLLWPLHRPAEARLGRVLHGLARLRHAILCTFFVSPLLFFFFFSFNPPFFFLFLFLLLFLLRYSLSEFVYIFIYQQHESY